MKETLVINLIAGPCSGKSTIAAELFARLKKMGVHCELCVEYIKDRIYEENQTIAKNQIAIFGMEHYGLKTKLGKVDVIIHDGSLLNNINYNVEDDPEFNRFIAYEYFKFNNLDFFIERGTLPFETYGRIHNEKESKQIDTNIKNLYHKYNLNFIELDSKDATDKILKYILDKLNEKI